MNNDYPVNNELFDPSVYLSESIGLVSLAASHFDAIFLDFGLNLLISQFFELYHGLKANRSFMFSNIF